MSMTIIEHSGVRMALMSHTNQCLNSAQEVLQMLMDVGEEGIEYYVLYATNLDPEFFHLQSGLAGDILQKVSNYRLALAILGDYSDVRSNSLRFFMNESNRAGRVLFVANIEEAALRWTSSRN